MRHADSPAWAPDGRSLAFERRHETESDIWRIDLDGTRARPLVRGDASDSNPTWSPDGTHIAFERSIRDVNRTHVMVIGGDGTGLRRLVRGRQTTQPAWSATGRRIAFIGYTDHSVYVANADGSAMRKVADDARILSGPPRWAPDGTLILFPRLRGWQDEDLYAVRTDGRRIRQVAADAHDPAWLPDGRRIVFARHNAILVVGVEGGHERPLVHAVSPGGLAVRP